jgi:hypothetical protein
MSLGWSRTGPSWTFSERNPVHPYYEITDSRFPSGVGDIIDQFYEPVRRRSGALVKTHTNPGNEFGLQGRIHPAGLGIRLTGLMTSPDGERWNPPRRAYVPDAHDEGIIPPPAASKSSCVTRTTSSSWDGASRYWVMVWRCP